MEFIIFAPVPAHPSSFPVTVSSIPTLPVTGAKNEGVLFIVLLPLILCVPLVAKVCDLDLSFLVVSFHSCMGFPLIQAFCMFCPYYCACPWLTTLPLYTPVGTPCVMSCVSVQNTQQLLLLTEEPRHISLAFQAFWGLPEHFLGRMVPTYAPLQADPLPSTCPSPLILSCQGVTALRALCEMLVLPYYFVFIYQYMCSGVMVESHLCARPWATW